MNQRPLRVARGFSLAELMVSVVIGLLALMFATRLVTGAESNKQAALGGSDSMQNGMLAMFSISNDASQAGFGLNDPTVVGCNTVLVDTGGFTLASAKRGATTTVRPMAAAVIESGGVNPDRITLYSGSSLGGTGTLRLTTDYVGGTEIDVDRVPYGFTQGDVILVAPETIGGDCALAQISSDLTALKPPPEQQKVLIAGGSAYRFNSGGLGAKFTAGMARLYDLGQMGSLSFHTWSVADGFLRLNATDLSGAGGGAAVADNIVSIKALYGFDTRNAAGFLPQDGLQVGQWSASMIDADGDGVSGSAGDYQRIAALRVAVVARSKNPERADASGTCHATEAAPKLFSAEQPKGVTVVEITPSLAVTGDPVDWKCYRYRVFETIIPLRNVGWRPSA